MALGDSAIAAYEEKRRSEEESNEREQLEADKAAISEIFAALKIYGRITAIETVTVTESDVDRRLYLIDGLAFEVRGPHSNFIDQAGVGPGIYLWHRSHQDPEWHRGRYSGGPIGSMEDLGKQIAHLEANVGPIFTREAITEER